MLNAVKSRFISGKKINFLLVASIICLFFLNGCTSSTLTTGSKPDGKWMLKTLDDKTIVSENTGGNMPFLSFNEKENSVGGNTGCNELGGKIVLTATEITFGEMWMTKMMCNDAKYELAFVGYLFHSETLKYKIENNILTFTKDGKVIMTLEKAN